MTVRVLFVTTGLESGGAEMMLYKLLSRMDHRRFECSVISLTSGGPVLGEKIRNLGIPLDILGFQRGAPNPMMIPALAKRIRSQNPDIVQTWMYHANLAGALAAKLVSGCPLIWAVHGAMLDPSRVKRQTRLVVAASRALAARGPKQIIYCSEAAAESHARLGYPAELALAIPNGIDTVEFAPDPEARAALREELGLPPDTPFIGLAARLDPEKDHGTFFRAAIQLTRARPDVHFVLCGSGVSRENSALWRMIEGSSLPARVHLLGLRHDMPRVTAALDIAVSCSVSEAFGLTLAEAMSCGMPCVTTDLPGPVSVVGDSGWIFPAGNHERLVEIWQEILALPANKRGEWGQRARERIKANFSLAAMVEGYERVYSDIVLNHG